jgi:hypothetical protein
LDAGALHAALPLLQPLALSAPARHDLRAHPGLLAELRHGLVIILGLPTEPPPQQLLRIRPRAVLILVVAALAAHIIVPQVAERPQIGHVLRRTRWDWLVAATVPSCFTYLAAAVAIVGAAGRRLPFGRTLLAQLVSSAANRLSPGGLGGVGMNAGARASGLPVYLAGLFPAGHVMRLAPQVARRPRDHQHRLRLLPCGRYSSVAARSSPRRRTARIPRPVS